MGRWQPLSFCRGVYGLAPLLGALTGALGFAVPSVAVEPSSIESVPAAVTAVRSFRAENEVRILQDFRNLLRLPNVSTSQADMVANADWIEAYLQQRGFEVEVFSAGRSPYVYAERNVDGAETTVLVYAHFDGQPVDAREWSSPPFEPTLRDGPVDAGGVAKPWEQLAAPVDPDWRIYARSAGDDKAPVIALAAAIDALDSAGLPASVNLKLILDGEEEAGSPTLAAILDRHGPRLEADLMLFCDGPMHQSRRRQLVFGVRGSMTVELTAYGANRPLHSGHYGNWAPNPTDLLIRVLASLKNADGEIAIAGYHDEVRPPSAAEIAAIAAMPGIDAELQAELGLARREGGEERIERLVLDPAIVIKGIQAGGVGDQSANVIRPTAQASLNLRLVPDQTPEIVTGHLLRHIQQLGVHVVREPPDEELLTQFPEVVFVDARGGYPGFRTRLDGEEAGKLVRLLDEIDGTPTLLTPTMGGSLPIHLFEQALEMPIILLPVANHDNNQHGADENLRIRNLWDAMEIYGAVLHAYGRPL